MKMIFKALTVLAVALIGGTGVTRAAGDGANLLVIATAGAAPVTTGDLLAPGQEVDIADDAAVLVLTRSGSVLRLTGPCRCRLPEGPAAARGKSGADAATRGFAVKSDLWNVALPKLQSLSKPAAAGSDGGVQPEPSPEPPDLWVVAVDRSGNRCVGRGGAFLWRQQVKAAATVDLRTTKAHQAGLTWPAGQPLMQLPGEFVIDGAPLILSIDSQRLRLVVHVLPVTIDESEWGEILIWMAARDCRRQAQYLVDGLNNGTLFPDHDNRPGLSEL